MEYGIADDGDSPELCQCSNSSVHLVPRRDWISFSASKWWRVKLQKKRGYAGQKDHIREFGTGGFPAYTNDKCFYQIGIPLFEHSFSFCANARNKNKVKIKERLFKNLTKKSGRDS